MRPMPELKIEELSVDELAAAERWHLSYRERALQAMLG